MGMGYVGYPLAVSFAEAGFEVVGFDVDKDTVNTVNEGDLPVEESDGDGAAELVEGGFLRATDNMEELSKVDAISICVPTPLRKSRDPDISYVAQATDTITDYFEPPGLITLESTTYPGTTEEILAEAFQDQGWNLEDDVLIAFSPERVDPGNEDFGIRNTPKVLGGYNSTATDVVSRLYGAVIEEVVTVSSTRTAEMVKLLENTFRSVNIGLANEMALLCDRMNIDVWEVIDAAKTKPYGFMPFYPGPGLGGHCIPIDPLFLSWKAKLFNTNSRFIELADEVNRNMPTHVFRKITRGLNKVQQSVNGSKICLFGVAYKPDVGDTRESPAKEIILELIDNGADVEFCDPHVDELKIEGEIIPSVSMDSVNSEDYDASVIVTDHGEFNWSELFGGGENVIIDTRNALPDSLSLPNAIVETI
ncbi:MAG: nucleotide sugar dehydrogenase [bacterium]